MTHSAGAVCCGSPFSNPFLLAATAAAFVVHAGALYVPATQLVLRVELVKRRRGLWRFNCAAEVDGKRVAETQILMADGPKS